MEETKFPGHTAARMEVLELLRPYQGKTVETFSIEDEPATLEDRHHSERLRMRFTDGSEVNIQIGTNLNTSRRSARGFSPEIVQ